MHFNIESYLESAARGFIGGFDPCCYVYLSQTMDYYDISTTYEDMPSAFADIELDSARIIGVPTDILWPVHQQKEIAKMLSLNGIDVITTEPHTRPRFSNPSQKLQGMIVSAQHSANPGTSGRTSW